MNIKKHSIKILLEDLMWKNRIKTISELSGLTNISRPTLTKLKNNESNQIDLLTLTTLCEKLHCEISDLLVYENREEI